jgi:hypothetical protein
MGNCLTCRWRSTARTPQLSADPAFAATCDYPMPNSGFEMIGFNVTDVSRHLNLATITDGSEWFHPDHAVRECRTWEPKS